MRAFSDPYFSVYKQNRIRIFPHKDNQYDYNHRREYMDQSKRVFWHILRSENLDVKHTFFTSCLKVKMERVVR